jgi:hypothetical protein
VSTTSGSGLAGLFGVLTDSDELSRGNGAGVVSRTLTTSGPTAPPAIASLDADVRDEVRRSGIDPLTQVETVRRFAQSAVRAHDDRSLSGAVRPLDDPERMVAELVARVAGFGPLQAYLDDPAVEEVWINQPDRVFVARDGSHELTTTILTTTEVRDLVERMLKTSGRRLDLSSPFVDAMLPSGHRLHVVLDGITRGFSAVNIHSKKTCAKFPACRQDWPRLPSAAVAVRNAPSFTPASAWIERVRGWVWNASGTTAHASSLTVAGPW